MGALILREVLLGLSVARAHFDFGIYIALDLLTLEIYQVEFVEALVNERTGVHYDLDGVVKNFVLILWSLKLHRLNL